ncbi:MAG: hypothetical protein JJT78_15425 [Leptospira sp.]|nr:hypothetical protein [Leptospira sp.]
MNDRYLIDSNIWIDIFTNDPVWCKWSEEKMILITRDIKRYRNYFPDVQLISP